MWRDPIEVVPSYYRMLLGRGAKIENYTDFADCTSDKWIQHVTGYLYDKSPTTMYFMEYRKLLADTHNEMNSMLDFMGWSVSEGNLDTAIKNSSIDEMKKQEETMILRDLRRPGISSINKNYRFIGNKFLFEGEGQGASIIENKCRGLVSILRA